MNNINFTGKSPVLRKGTSNTVYSSGRPEQKFSSPSEHLLSEDDRSMDGRKHNNAPLLFIDVNLGKDQGV